MPVFRSTGLRTSARVPSRNASAALRARACGRASNAGLIATRMVATNMIAASTSIAAAGPAAPAIAPARAGPSTNDTLRLDASIALA